MNSTDENKLPYSYTREYRKEYNKKYRQNDGYKEVQKTYAHKHYEKFKDRYKCDLCNFSCAHMKDLEKHFTRKKHIKNELISNNNLKISGSTPILIKLSEVIGGHTALRSIHAGAGEPFTGENVKSQSS